ncbi:MAG: DUF2344 domain-containing protein, partial [Clostridia bacterium]|nr:DUF2344 domain-containing protein [Clostridia bacterium]
PKISFGPALAVGISGYGEYADMEFSDKIDPRETMEILNLQMPLGLTILKTVEIPVGSPSITALIVKAEYEIRCPFAENCCREEDLAQVIKKFLCLEQIMVEKRTKKGMRLKNIRRGIYSLKGKIKDNGIYLHMLLQLNPSGSVTPDDVLKGMRKNLYLPGDWGAKDIKRIRLLSEDSSGSKTSMLP